MIRQRACSVTEHNRIKADPDRWRAEMVGHQPWPGLGEMAHHHCNSTLLLPLDGGAEGTHVER